MKVCGVYASWGLVPLRICDMRGFGLRACVVDMKGLGFKCCVWG